MFCGERGIEGSFPFSVAAGDFNDDAKLDLAVANFGSNTVTIFLGNGDGTFQWEKALSTSVRKAP